MTRKLENRSLDRGITVLETLGQGGAMTLHNLHLQTELPKSTLRRLLATLIARRIVRVGLADKRYRTNVALPALNHLDLPPRAARLVELAMPHMIELTQKVSWPSDLHIFSSDRMRIVESTRSLSPFHIYRGPIDIGVNVFASAGGRAYLSALEQSDVEAIVQSCGEDAKLGLSPCNIEITDLLSDLDCFRTQRYATRHANYQAERKEGNDLNVIAVPLLRERESVGALTLIWPRAYLAYNEFAEKFLPDLLDTAARIAEGLRNAD